MRRATLFLLAACVGCAAGGGCASYADTKIELAAQARRGVALAKAATQQREQMLATFDAKQRQQLDDAFDADVLSRAGLTADWVLAHRKAYALAVDALRNRRAEADRAKQAALSNLDAVDRALAQLQTMQDRERQFSLSGGGQ